MMNLDLAKPVVIFARASRSTRHIVVVVFLVVAVVVVLVDHRLDLPPDSAQISLY